MCTLEDVQDLVNEVEEQEVLDAASGKHNDDDEGDASVSKPQPSVSLLVGGEDREKKTTKKNKKGEKRDSATTAGITLTCLLESGHAGKGLEIDPVVIQWGRSQAQQIPGVSNPSVQFLICCVTNKRLKV